MKFFSHAKLRALVCLCLVAIGLLIGLLFYLPYGSNTAAGEPDKNEHQRIRTAQISLNPSLSWELSLAGSGEEEVVESFVSEGYIYIFGNTASEDLDFERAGIFLAIVDVFGVTKAFFSYGDEGDVLRSACLCEGGFLLAVESTSPKLIVVDHSGLVKKTVGGFIQEFESVAEVKYYSGGYLLFTHAENTLTKVRTLRCSFFTSTVQFATGSIAVSSYSLNLFESVVVSGKAVAVCNATSTLHTLPALVEFSQTQPVKINLLSGHPGKVVGLSIFEGDLLLLTTEAGSTLLKTSLAAEVRQKTTLSQLKALGLTEVGGELLGGESPTQYYLAFLDTAVYMIDGHGNRKSTMAAFTPHSRAYIRDVVVYAGESGGNLAVNVYSDQKIVFGATLPAGSTPKITLDESNIFCIYHSGGDIQIAKLRYPIFW